LLHGRFNQSQEVLADAAKVLASQDAEIKNLKRTIQEAESAQAQQKAIYEDVVQVRQFLRSDSVRFSLFSLCSGSGACPTPDT
jgi:hypothetical protein